VALSNWDLLAFDENAKPCNGRFHPIKKSRFWIEIYKNWVYFHGPKTKRGENGFSTQINQGDIQIGRFKIIAQRIELQEAVFVFTSWSSPKFKKFHWMVGIGCSAYDDPLPRLCKAAGINPKNWDHVVHGWSSCNKDNKRVDDDDEGYITVEAFKFNKGETKVIRRKRGYFHKPEFEYLDSQYVGVSPELYEKFLHWLEELPTEFDTGIWRDEDYEQWLSKIKESRPIRINQGNMYFQQHLGMKLSGTDVGEQEEVPEMVKIIGNITPKPKEQANA